MRIFCAVPVAMRRRWTLYERIVKEHPFDASALYGLANSRLDEYLQNEESAMLLLAKEAARGSGRCGRKNLEATVCVGNDGVVRRKPGNAATFVAEEALSRNENEKVLSNLGTFYTCAGDFEKARDTYLRARERLIPRATSAMNSSGRSITLSAITRSRRS